MLAKPEGSIHPDGDTTHAHRRRHIIDTHARVRALCLNPLTPYGAPGPGPGPGPDPDPNRHRCVIAAPPHGRRWRSTQKQTRLSSVPIIVGGVGDSGTRGVMDVLQELGVYMMGDENTTNSQRDSILFTAPLYACNNNMTAWSYTDRRAANSTVAESVKEELNKVCTHYQRRCCPSQLFPKGGSWVSDKDAHTPWGMGTLHRGPKWGVENTACRKQDVRQEDACGHPAKIGITRRVMEAHAVRAAAALKRDPGKFYMWGLKHPRTALVLPLLREALGPDGFK